jgi:hypothetical protein
MPVEINELVIRASISSASTPAQAATQPTDNQQNIQQIVDELLRKLKSREER